MLSVPYVLFLHLHVLQSVLLPYVCGLPKLFGENSFPEADRFVNVGPVSNEPEFENFFNICNRCFVESIEKYGKSLGKKKYFWNEIKSTYPALFDVLHRIKVYRHSSDHLELNPMSPRSIKNFGTRIQLALPTLKNNGL